MRSVQNFKEKINSLRHIHLHELGVGSFELHCDNQGWLWVEPKVRGSVFKNCLRINFDWKNNKANVHVIPIGAGINAKSQYGLKLDEQSFLTYDKFIDWISTVIRISEDKLKQ